MYLSKVTKYLYFVTFHHWVKGTHYLHKYFSWWLYDCMIDVRLLNSSHIWRFQSHLQRTRTTVVFSVYILRSDSLRNTEFK